MTAWGSRYLSLYTDDAIDGGRLERRRARGKEGIVTLWVWSGFGIRLITGIVKGGMVEFGVKEKDGVCVLIKK
jgi:hypothetical protein